jgi:serine protease Do
MQNKTRWTAALTAAMGFLFTAALAVAGQGFLGVSLVERGGERAQELNPAGKLGVVISSVVPDSPAAAAGLEAGDVIVGFDGEKVRNSRQLVSLVHAMDAGDLVDVEVKRDGRRESFETTLGERSPARLLEHFTMPRMPTMPNMPEIHAQLRQLMPQRFAQRPRLGIKAEAMSDQLAAYFGADAGGVLVGEVIEDTPAAVAGLQAGDVIVRLDGEELSDLADLREALSDAEAGKSEIVIIRNKRERRLSVELEQPEVGDHSFFDADQRHQLELRLHEAQELFQESFGGRQAEWAERQAEWAGRQGELAERLAEGAERFAAEFEARFHAEGHEERMLGLERDLHARELELSRELEKAHRMQGVPKSGRNL